MLHMAGILNNHYKFSKIGENICPYGVPCPCGLPDTPPLLLCCQLAYLGDGFGPIGNQNTLQKVQGGT